MIQKFKITSCAFTLCLFGLTLMTVSPVFAQNSAAFKQCQQIKPNGTSVPLMKQKKNCFKNLAGPRNSAAFKQCKQIKPQGAFQPMKQKKNCFRALAATGNANQNGDQDAGHCAALHPVGAATHVDPPESQIEVIAAEYEASCKAGNCALSESTYSRLESQGHSRAEVMCFLAEGEAEHEGRQGNHSNAGGNHPQGDPCMKAPAGPDRKACYAIQRP